MDRPLTGKLADLHGREARARKATNARITLNTHIAAIATAAGELTPEQADRLRALLPASADAVMRTSDLHVVVVGVLVALAVIGLTRKMELS